MTTFNVIYTGEIFANILVLPYAGKELKMFIMLPDENVNSEMVEKNLFRRNSYYGRGQI